MMIKTISEIVNQLVSAHDRGEQINLTKLKTQVSAKYKLAK
jgi:elongator complex protein 3